MALAVAHLHRGGVRLQYGIIDGDGPTVCIENLRGRENMRTLESPAGLPDCSMLQLGLPDWAGNLAQSGNPDHGQ